MFHSSRFDWISGYTRVKEINVVQLLLVSFVFKHKEILYADAYGLKKSLNYSGLFTFLTLTTIVIIIVVKLIRDYLM